MGVNLTPGAITKIMTGECTENDLKPVVQVTNIASRTCAKDNKLWYVATLSDGSSRQVGFVAVGILISNKLQNGSIVQLTKFQLTKPYIINNRARYFIFVYDMHVILSKYDNIGDPSILPYNETPLMEKSVPPISHRDDSDLNEDVDDSHRGEEPPALKQNPSDSIKNRSSHSLTQTKKRKCQSSNDNISAVVKDICKIARTMMEKNKEDGVDACYKKLEKLEEDVSKMTSMIMEKNKEDVVGFKKLETLEEDVSKITKMMTEKNKEDGVDVCYEKLEKLEEDVSEMSRMMMKIYKEDDMGACIEKLDKIGWGAQDPMYDTALLLFGQSADYRKLWLHLKPESCGNWVKSAGSMFGLLD